MYLFLSLFNIYMDIYIFVVWFISLRPRRQARILVQTSAPVQRAEHEAGVGTHIPQKQLRKPAFVEGAS